jgi:hypothetical protein
LMTRAMREVTHRPRAEEVRFYIRYREGGR